MEPRRPAPLPSSSAIRHLRGNRQLPAFGGAHRCAFHSLRGPRHRRGHGFHRISELLQSRHGAVTATETRPNLRYFPTLAFSATSTTATDPGYPPNGGS